MVRRFPLFLWPCGLGYRPLNTHRSPHQVTFDVFVLVMLFANAVNRPYRENSEIVETLRKDGIKYLTVSTVQPFQSGQIHYLGNRSF